MVFFILFGTYRFGLKKIGVRKDFCNACKRECVAERWSSFNCGHIFGIPLLPLGPRKRWCCSLCGRDPRARYKTRKGFKIAGLFVLALILASVWFTRVTPEVQNTVWGGRIVLSILFLCLLYSVIKRPSLVSEEERRKAVVPLCADSCFYCGGSLASQPHLHCPSCQVQICT